MEDGRYVGQYRSDFSTVTIENGKLVFKLSHEDPVTAAFTPDGLPDELLVDGGLLNFFK
ncbi:hypothetical protein GRI89_00370 [Altererythrobacter salegens]|uniref:Uncharacterized protein n=1 Tax=Croceibacterium salegens TaxID=1737568 RepID=A0A6I4SQU2_9SPHN|nr:hypothetical protein [Croceibacterium salegens]MXO57999.1 hypothetical protein [Croceibacterium salegens]